jgi:hypothetical protein
VSALDAKIDDLYRLPLAEFTGARNALAKSLSGDDAKRVRKLEKPTIVPWAANQVYWRARSTYDRLMKSGEKLRAAQIAALEGRAADVRAASEAHRRAIADAVAEAERLCAGAKPSPDALARTFESLSLATHPPETPGRLTDALQPAGFEALAGITDINIKVRSEKLEGRSTGPELVKSSGERRTPNVEPRTANGEPRTANGEPRTSDDEQKAARTAALAAEKAAARLAEERAKHAAAVRAAEADLTRAEDAEHKARETWERAHDALLAARQALTELRRSRFKGAE